MTVASFFKTTQMDSGCVGFIPWMVSSEGQMTLVGQSFCCVMKEERLSVQNMVNNIIGQQNLLFQTGKAANRCAVRLNRAVKNLLKTTVNAFSISETVCKTLKSVQEKAITAWVERGACKFVDNQPAQLCEKQFQEKKVAILAQHKDERVKTLIKTLMDQGLFEPAKSIKECFQKEFGNLTAEQLQGLYLKISYFDLNGDSKAHPDIDRFVKDILESQERTAMPDGYVTRAYSSAM